MFLWLLTALMAPELGSCDKPSTEGVAEAPSCGDREVLNAIKKRDPLKMGLAHAGDDRQAVQISRLLRALLRWNPADRMPAQQASELAFFGEVMAV